MKTTKKKMATMFGIASDLSGKIDVLLAEILREIDRPLADIAAARPCSTLGSRVEMLVRERDASRGVIKELSRQLDELRAERLAAHGVLDIAKVGGHCSTMGSRVEMLVRERDAMRSAPASTLPPGAVEWLRSGRRGASSDAIFGHLTGIPVADHGRCEPPRDSGDLLRCRSLLDLVPDFRARLTEMATISPVWAALVGHWDELCALQDRELAGIDDARLWVTADFGVQGEVFMRMCDLSNEARRGNP